MEINRCARLYNAKDLRLEDTPILEPGSHQVQIKVGYVGICATDVHFYDHGKVDRYILTRPTILGHEISGVVSQLGSGVTSLNVGERVAVDPNQPCGLCRFCQMDRHNLCEQLMEMGIPNTDGGWCHVMVVPASNCHRLPDSVDLQAGVCLEPLSIGVRGLKRCQIKQGDVVVVLGAGTIGLLALQAAKAMGARIALVADVKSSRLDLAADLGADFTYTVELDKPIITAEAVKQLLGCDADIVVECSGATGTIDTAILTCRPGGTVMILGIGEMALYSHIGMAALREITVMGSVGNVDNFPECIQLVSSGQVNVKSIITHVLLLDEVHQAIDLVRDGSRSIKVLIECNGYR